MTEWTDAEEKSFQELVKRAEQQSRDYYIRSGGVAEVAPPQPQERHRGTTGNRQVNSSGQRTAMQQHPISVATQPVPQRPNRGVTLAPPPPPQPPQPQQPQPRYRVKRKPTQKLLPEIDSETALLAALLWVLWQDEADITVILAVAYILLV